MPDSNKFFLFREAKGVSAATSDYPGQIKAPQAPSGDLPIDDKNPALRKDEVISPQVTMQEGHRALFGASKGAGNHRRDLADHEPIRGGEKRLTEFAEFRHMSTGLVGEVVSMNRQVRIPSGLPLIPKVGVDRANGTGGEG